MNWKWYQLRFFPLSILIFCFFLKKKQTCHIRHIWSLVNYTTSVLICHHSALCTLQDLTELIVLIYDKGIYPTFPPTQIWHVVILLSEARTNWNYPCSIPLLRRLGQQVINLIPLKRALLWEGGTEGHLGPGDQLIMVHPVQTRVGPSRNLVT